MKILFVSLLLLLMGVVAVQAQTADLFISEYVEGSSSNKALEIYNGTADAIEISNYELLRYSNGATTGFPIPLTAHLLQPNEVHVIADSFADSALLALADQTSSDLNFNGNDALVLMRGTQIIDSFGQVGTDPGASWDCAGGTTANQTLRRLPSICNGDLVPDDPFDPCLEWEFLNIDNFDGLGGHSSDCVSVGTGLSRWESLKACFR